MIVEGILENLANRGIRLTPDGDGLIVEPASKLTDVDRRLIRQHKAALLARLTDPEAWVYERATATALHCEQHGIDLADYRKHPDDAADSDPPYKVTPAESIVATCLRHVIALSLDDDGLRVSKADGSGQEPALWPSLLLAINAHLEAVIALVAGWHLRADPKLNAA
jgi:hypothetical protein